MSKSVRSYLEILSTTGAAVSSEFSKLVQFGKKQYLIMICLAGVIIFPVLFQYILINIKLHSTQISIFPPEKLQVTKNKLEKEIVVLNRKLAGKTPDSYYLVINSADNEFTLFRGTKIIRKDKCSTGSYILLKNGDEQQWMFNTPRGEFRIRGKTTSPVWKKPDWAFIEEGLPVPPSNHYSRYEAGVLGDYALDLGRGYLIHGTLYQRFLGLPVTHGCIRLGDENLELVYRSLQTGSKVYIY